MSDSSAGTSNLTPLMQQYFDIKAQHKDAILLFQVGDFYELFFEDAKRVAAFLGIALTKRGTINGEPIPLCGVPIHALDHHLSKLVKGGFKVVICDQLEEATPGKVVRRGVSNVLTPGTITDLKLLDSKKASYILFFITDGSDFGGGVNRLDLYFVELLAGQIFNTTVPYDDLRSLEAELSRFFPDEIVISSSSKTFLQYFKKLGYTVSFFDSVSDKNLGLDQKVGQNWASNFTDFDQNASDIIYNYFLKNNPAALNYIRDFYKYRPDEFLMLDSSTQKNLELISNSQDGSKKNTLFDLMDMAVTPMGSRQIKKWILRPFVKIEQISNRLDAVSCLVKDINTKEELISLLKSVADLERVVGRIALQKGQPHDYIHLKNAIFVSPQVVKVLNSIANIKLYKSILSKITNFESLFSLLQAALVDDLSSDFIIRPGFDDKLDYMRDLVQNSQLKILELESREIQNSGISSLKIRYNDVFGYYIEITKANLDLVPDHYKRTQTLSNRERFTIPELKQLELDIERSKKEIVQLEQELYRRVKSEVDSNIPDLKRAAYALAHLDGLIGLAELAYSNNYVRPEFNQDNIYIKGGRHPVVEKVVDSFISNSTNLCADERLWIVTGPNMGGKSTYLRQVALICLMAQCGSFVPAKSGNFKLLDRIFSRIGAGDNLAEGKSTFLVEMEETALICRQATKNSLVILDEVGRGTSTYDGLAIAQSVVEYIYNSIGAYCLFATHYHELTKLEKDYSGIVSYFAASRQTESGILFLHNIERGCANGSFGLEVAKLANLPEDIVYRASQILKFISKDNLEVPAANNAEFVIPATLHNKLKKYESLTNILNSANLDEISPRMALDLVWKLKENI